MQEVESSMGTRATPGRINDGPWGANAMGSITEPLPTLVLNPADDEEFRSAANHLVESGFVEPTVLQDRLRARWPGAIVRQRELAGERFQMWYVYRDGHWIRRGL
jgi:hypothetical protein